MSPCMTTSLTHACSLTSSWNGLLTLGTTQTVSLSPWHNRKWDYFTYFEPFLFQFISYNSNKGTTTTNFSVAPEVNGTSVTCVDESPFSSTVSKGGSIYIKGIMVSSHERWVFAFLQSYTKHCISLGAAVLIQDPFIPCTGWINVFYLLPSPKCFWHQEDCYKDFRKNILFFCRGCEPSRRGSTIKPQHRCIAYVYYIIHLCTLPASQLETCTYALG